MKSLFVFLLSCSCLQCFAKNDITPTSEFKVGGAVKKEISFRTDNIGNYRQDTLGDLIVKNRKGEQKGISKNLKGILLKSILDSAGIIADKPKEYGRIIIVLTASDGFTNVFSWNEIFNTDIGNHIYVITEMDGLSIDKMPDRILVLSMSDFNTGGRHLKGLAKIEVKKIY